MSSYWNARECTDPEAFCGGTPDDDNPPAIREEMIGAAEKYVRAIRCETKREYAAEFMLWLIGERPKQPMHYGCSYMAAQAVRAALHKILDAAQ